MGCGIWVAVALEERDITRVPSGHVAGTNGPLQTVARRSPTPGERGGGEGSMFVRYPLDDIPQARNDMHHPGFAKRTEGTN